MSHATHFIDRYLEGYGWESRHHHPPMDLVSLYVDQFPEKDLARERAKRFNVPIFPSIAEALTLGGGKLAVDGVLIIGEHGSYPKNEKGQTLYPRFKFFQETMAVFKASGRAVPVFNDKHLSTNWVECTEMMRASKELGFPFLAGSSLPVTWRIPSLELSRNVPLEESVCVCYGGVDSYDFHGYETAQCMSERRRGGELGIKSVQAFRGPTAWATLRQRPQTVELVLAALSRSHTLRGMDGYMFSSPDLNWLEQHCKSPIVFYVEHRDGFRTTMMLLNDLVQDFTYAGRLARSGKVMSCQMYLPMPPARTTLANFFSPLVNNIERMILENRAPYPAERTLLTSGMVIAGVESLFRGKEGTGALIETPEMGVVYSAPRASGYWRT